MSQRDSGYKRLKNDSYETPDWVTEALVPFLPPAMNVWRLWECAAGKGGMAAVLRKAGYTVKASDITTGTDFLKSRARASWIITNPPYTLAQEFIEHALAHVDGGVAMLLRTDYDHAKERVHLFGKCPQFAAKIVLTTRIKWFKKNVASPSFNHAWYIWAIDHDGPPHLYYSHHRPNKK